MKKIVVAVTIFCICSLGATTQDSTWKAHKKMQFKTQKDIVNRWFGYSAIKKLF